MDCLFWEKLEFQEALLSEKRNFAWTTQLLCEIHLFWNLCKEFPVQDFALPQMTCVQFVELNRKL